MKVCTYNFHFLKISVHLQMGYTCNHPSITMPGITRPRLDIKGDSCKQLLIARPARPSLSHESPMMHRRRPCLHAEIKQCSIQDNKVPPPKVVHNDKYLNGYNCGGYFGLSRPSPSISHCAKYYFQNVCSFYYCGSSC